MRGNKVISRKTNRHSSLIIIACILFALLMFIIFGVVFKVSKENVLNIGHLNSTQLAQDLEYYLIEESNEITLASRTIEIMQEEGKSNEEILDYLTFESRIVSETIDENYTGIYGYINEAYLDGSGWVPETDYDPTTRPWYTDGIAAGGNVVYVTPYVDSETGSVMLSICKMLDDRKSVVSLDVSMDRVQNIVQSDDFEKYDDVIVTDKDYIVVSARDDSLLGKDLSDDPMITSYSGSDEEQASGTYCVYRTERGDRNAVFSSNVRGQWNVFLIIRSSKLMSSLNIIYAILACGTVAFITFVVLTLYHLNRRRKAAENLNIQLESIADIYTALYKFDLENDSIEEIKSLPFIRDMKRTAESTSSNSHEVLEKVMTQLVIDEYLDALKTFIDPDTLDVRAGRSNTVSLELLGIHGWIKVRIIILERKNDRISSFLWMVENIDEEKRKQNELRYLSETDLMTGLRNRGCGERMVKEQLENRVGGMFCMIDADDFKSINDNYGHDVGDTVIRTIADCLTSSFRKSDIILRLGGDEFAIYVEGIHDREHAQEILGRFMKTLKQVSIPEFKGERCIEISIGASFVLDGVSKDFEALYKEADKAMYVSKRKPGSCVTFFGEGK